MAQTKYVNKNWPGGSPISGERLATNGLYTGQHKGSVAQDYAEGADNDPYVVERHTIRQGTLLGDYLDTNFPTVGVMVEQRLVGASPASGSEADVYAKNGAKTFTFTADTNYTLSDYCKVYIGGEEATSGTDFTYTKGAGTVAFAANKLSADTVIDLRAKKSGEVALIQKLTYCTSDTEDGIIKTADGLEVVVTAASGKALPSSITVKIGGNTATASTDYTWTKATGTIAIASGKLTGDVEITVTAS